MHLWKVQYVLAGLPLLVSPFEVIQTPTRSDLSLGNDFNLTWHSNYFDITQFNTSIWSTVPGKPFVVASAGNDTVVESSGAFNISHGDESTCQSQNVLSFQYVDWEGAITGFAVQIHGQLLKCGNATAPYQLTFWVPAESPDRVAFSLNVSPSSSPAVRLNKVYLRYASHAGEDFYGFGGQASFSSLKNQSVPIFSREQGVGRGDEPITQLENSNGSIAGGDKFTAYTAIASYITTDGRLFYLTENSTAYANFDLTDPNAVTVRYDSLSVEGAFARGVDMFDAVSKLTAATGRMPALPDWVDEGAILGIQGGQNKVNSIVQQGLNLSCPIAAVWLQDWEGTHSQTGPYVNISRLWWNWENDVLLYPNWTSFVQNLRTQYNVRTLTYVNTFLVNVSSKSDGYRRNLFDEAASQSFLVQNTTTNTPAIISSGPGLSAGIIDLTNPGLKTWFKEVLKTQVWNANISGYMSDFGEYTPVTPETKLYNASDAFFFHDLYPLLWARYQREFIEEFGLQDEALIFHRSAATGANKYMNLFWAGDQNVNWGRNDGIKSAVTNFAHMGLSGYAHQHSDVGGYTDTLTYENYNVTRSAELLGRWGELAAVSSAVFRSHEGNIPEVNAQFYSNTTTYTYYAYNARLFVSLAPYRRKVLQTESATKGWPLLRPPVMYHPADPTARQISYESFYLGPHLYVAPVLDPQTFEISVYLPGEGTFTHVWSGTRYTAGQTVTVSAPYGKPAVFLVNDAQPTELKPFLEFVKKENGTVLSVE